jgi:hypothetical protein
VHDAACRIAINGWRARVAASSWSLTRNARSGGASLASACYSVRPSWTPISSRSNGRHTRRIAARRETARRARRFVLRRVVGL